MSATARVNILEIAWRLLILYLFERSEFLSATCKKKKLTVCVCGCSASLGFSVEKIVLVLVWGTYYVPARTAVQASCLARVKKITNEMFK